EDQNTQQQLDRLAAQRYIYSQSKKLLTLQMLLTIAIPITLSISVTIVQNLKIWAAFYGIVISIIDVAFIEHYQKSLKTRATKIQELFDCDVLKIKWHDLKAGNRPDNEIISEAAENFKKKCPEYKGLKNWYPVSITPLPLHLARLVCQRTNCWWNSKLRRRYKAVLLTGIILIILVFVAISIHKKMTMMDFILSLFAPFSPTILWALREYYKQSEAADALDKLKSHIEDIWTKIINKELTEESIESISRDIQNEIFDRRRSDPVVFDWLYKLLRDNQEVQMNKGAEELVREALISLNTGGAS
ncbi:MAG: S-4TM family putative pore-forming effector, partial [Nitrospirota bacterium]